VTSDVAEQKQCCWKTSYCKWHTHVWN